jgi:hypothetical protein
MALLADVVVRCVANVSAWAALAVDAKDEAVAAFYGRFGFMGLPDNDRNLFIMRKPILDYTASLLPDVCGAHQV